MNTVRSVGYGWAVLIAAGGGAYYFAKKSINEDRATRSDADRKRRELQRRLEYGDPTPTGDGSASPSKEASADPAPTRHVEGNEKSKYEATQAWKSRKGDRFS